MDVLSLNQGYLTMRTLSPGRIWVSSCNLEHPLTQSLSK